MPFLDRFRWNPRVRKGVLFARATLSPWGLAAGGALAGIGLALGIGLPFVIAAALAAWLTSAVLHLRDPALLSSLLAPEFDRDLAVLDEEHLAYMTAGLAARDRFEAAVDDLPGKEQFGGMRARVTEALRRMYDSAVWTQRADRFLATVDADALARRLRAAAKGSALAEELREQLEETEQIRARREETVSQLSATVAGIETLAVKMGGLALEATAPGRYGVSTTEVRRLRHELDTYVDALAEVERTLPATLPEQE
ncbi:MAG: hypothetical protein FJW79_06425 [Actinobacteria bacterium]|nr:hypothetical protein [Actinomycetota bacterium]